MTAKEQVEGLMNELLGFAEKMLRKYGEFHPFGGYLAPTRAVVHVGVRSNPESSDAQQELNTLINSFRNLAVRGEGIAFGTVADVMLPMDNGDKGYAIKFHLEHRDGYCADIYFRYEITDSVMRITDTIAQQGEPQIFSFRH